MSAAGQVDPTSAHRIRVKIFRESGPAIEAGRIVSAFHRLIQERALAEVMIDVADYSHVHEGPGVVLVCHDAHYAVDLASARPGLCYSRKRPVEGSFGSRLVAAVRAAHRACRALEADPDLQHELSFDPSELEISIVDSLRAPPTPETLRALEPPLQALFCRLWPDAPIDVRRVDGPGPTPRVLLRGRGDSRWDDLG